MLGGSKLPPQGVGGVGGGEAGKSGAGAKSKNLESFVAANQGKVNSF